MSSNLMITYHIGVVNDFQEVCNLRQPAGGSDGSAAGGNSIYDLLISFGGHAMTRWVMANAM